jgi:hypothetical protein
MQFQADCSLHSLLARAFRAIFVRFSHSFHKHFALLVHLTTSNLKPCFQAMRGGGLVGVGVGVAMNTSRFPTTDLHNLPAVRVE